MRLTVLLALVLLSESTQAQLSSGVKAGANFSSLVYTYAGSSAGQTDRVSLHLGLYAKAQLSKKSAIHTDFLYSSQGGVSSYLGDCTLGYFSVPVTYAYTIAPTAYVEAGVQPSFLLSAEIGGDDFQDVFSDFDCGLVFGIGVEGPIGTTISLRYIAGLLNVSESYASYLFGYGPTDFVMTNRVIQLSVGYSLSK